MIHKLLAGKGRMKKVVSLLLCLALLGSSVISTNVSAAETDTDVTVEAETTEENSESATEAQTVDSTEPETEAESETVTESVTESTEATVAEVETEGAAVGSTSPAVTLTGSVDEVSVSVNAPEGAFASGVSMVVSAVDVDAFAKAVVADCMASDGGTYTVYDAAAVEISFYDADGTEVQPATEVEVTLGNLDLNTGDDDLTKYAIIYHMNDDGTMEYIADGNPGESSYTFSASSFSAYGLIVASVEYDVEAIPGGGGSFNPGGGSNSDYSEHIDVRINGGTFTYTKTTTESTVYNVAVNKVWEDDKDHSGDSVTVYLVDSDGNRVKDDDGNEISATLSSNNSWSYTWENLDLEVGEYGIEEVEVDGYASSSTTFEVEEAGSSESEETVSGTIALTGISGTLTYTHDGTTYTVTDPTTTNTSDGAEYHFEDSSIALDNGDKITVVVSFTVTYSDGSTETFSNITYTETVSSDNNKCSANGYDFYVYASDLFSATQEDEIDETIIVTNTPSTTSVTVKKVVTGNMGDTTKEFSFTLTDEEGNDLTGSNGFTLSSGEYTTISGITIGSTIILAENSDGYDMSVECSSGTVTKNEDGSYSIVVNSSDGVTITVTNDKDVEPDTGINLDTAPYLAILFGVALFGTATLINRRRRLL